MQNTQKMTRDCLVPWKIVNFRPDGILAPCCAGPPPTGDYGNIYNADLQKTGINGAKALFANEAYRNIRRELLEGELQMACKICRIIDKDIPTELLRKKVADHLRYCGRTITELTDLTQEYAFTDCYTDVTDRCNFSCIYCFLHSNDKNGRGSREYLDVDMSRFLEIFSFLADDCLEYMNFCWLGEFTMHPQWKDICREIFLRHPKMRISLVSNFGRKYSDEDLDVLSRFFEIRISCDTMDPEKYSWLRRGGRLPVLIDNINNLRTRFKPGAANPRLIFIVTESDAILSGLTELARFAVQRNISIYMSNRAPVEDSVATVTECLGRIADLPDPQILNAWEIIHDLPRRTRAEHPPIDYFCDMGPLYNIVRQRAESITLNQFTPSEEELVYKSFAVSQQKNPEMYLKKLFLSFDDCIKGIFIRPGFVVDVLLPHTSGVLKYRIIWCKDISGKSLHIHAGSPSTAVVGDHLAFSAIKCPQRFTHVLFEILSYEPCQTDKPVAHMLDSSLAFPFYPLNAVAEYPDRRYESAMAVSEFLKAYPGIHKIAERAYRNGMRVLSRIRRE